MSSYPNAYCVKCGSHTDTQKKHTVLLQNNARALRGVCPSCESEVYKILPKLKDAGPKQRLTEDEKRRYPDAFCVRCQAHTPTVNAHTVILDNMSRAVTGSCRDCGNEVYRIIGNSKAEGQSAAAAPALAPASARTGHIVAAASKQVYARKSSAAPALAMQPKAAERRVPLTRRAEPAAAEGRWTFLLATGLIASIVTAFVVLAAM